MLKKILKIYERATFNFTGFTNPEDEFSYLFPRWVDYYKMKYSICKAIKPRSILEIGVRYGYSAITFLKASPKASYIGLDNNSDTFGGVAGAFSWAQKITKGYKAQFVIGDTQKMKELPGKYYDLIHVDGQQDGDGTYKDLEMALEKGKFILVDGYFWSAENMLGSTYFLKKYNAFIEYALIIPGYAGDLLIKTKDSAKVILADRNVKYQFLKKHYDMGYYLTDCGGFETFSKTNGMQLDERLKAVCSLANPFKGESILDIGCGRGELAYTLSNSEANVIGLDYSKDAIEIAKKTYIEYIGDHLQFITADILEFNTDKKFDKIIASDVVEHLEQDILELILNKISSMLTDNGLLIIHTAPNLLSYKYGYSMKRKLVQSVGSYLPANPRTYYEDLMHINEQTPGRLNRTLKKSFRNTLTWVARVPDTAGSLYGTFHISDFRNANSIFSIASNKEINKESVIESVTQNAMNKDEMYVNITIPEVELELKPSELYKLPLTLINRSINKISSNTPYPFYLSYHIMNDKGETYVFDGLRTPLETSVFSGGILKAYLNLKAPDKLGSYLLQVSMVQEWCFWLEDTKSQLPHKIEIVVKE